MLHFLKNLFTKPKLRNETFIANSHAFCIMPWVHLHVTQTGIITPCCVAPWDAEKGFGKINGQTIDEIWNGEAIRSFRLNQLKDKPDERCTRCYKKEQSGLYSLRKATNQEYIRHIDRVKNTQSDGRIVNAPPVYFDIRYSNFCNFKCRICGPWSSTSWFNDAKAMGMNENDLRLTHAIQDEDRFFEMLEQYLPAAEEIYFAGGEPLLMEQHYRVLDMLLQKGLTKVYLRYNSNFSTFEFKGKSIIDYWKKFENIFLCASLDDTGKRGELQRKEQKWKDVIAKRKLLLLECPHIDFMLAPTVNILNVFNLPAFHREWTEQGLIDVSEIFPSILEDPKEYNIQLLPADLKEKIKELYQNHAAWIELQPSKDEVVKQVVKNEFLKCITFMQAEDLSNLIPNFKKLTIQLDNLRNENTAETLPELKVLLD